MTVPAAPPAVEPFDAVDAITVKRDGVTLTDVQIDRVVEAYTRGAVAEERMGTLVMAIYLRGMSRAEIACRTEAIIVSGERMDFSGLSRPTADKHFTGGVGDKITLPPAPIVVVSGVSVPQLSGRGLGHTGGALDKLESTPGWRAELMGEEVLVMLDADGPGVVICAAGAGLTPVDKHLCALRGTTATVSRVPFIASSIMSKKIAEGTGAPVLDVKVNSGAFMKELGQARELVSTMVALDIDAGVITRALLTDMPTPLGRVAGNILEVAESLEVLVGRGPVDAVDLTVAPALEMCTAAGRSVEEDAACIALVDGRAIDIWCGIISRQDGNPNVPLPLAPETEIAIASADGVLITLDALAVGVAAWRLGAGWARKEDPAQTVVGVTMHAKPGDEVRADQPLLTLHTATPECLTCVREMLTGGIVISEAGSPETADAVARRQCGVILKRIG